MSKLILIVEDEPDLVENLDYNLRREGFEADAALTGQQALARLHERPLPDLIVLDLMLPDLSGFEICRRVRADQTTRHIPILMLTARGEDHERVEGFEAGADDYVVKPFNVRELMLRVRAVLRRSEGPDDAPALDQVSFGRLRVDFPAVRVWIDDEPISLTALEFRLLETLFTRRGRAQSREVLLSDVWDIQADVMTRTVDTHIKRLREKLGPCGPYIETLRGIGYRFCATPPDL
ncbi:DNA-binding response regulator [Bradymonadaceae bacterium TMQ3]|uniref:Response regulator transcription factor n=1 Tax=Lujinxingia sediminis TaxID=2480984 RepID=A0ABY0CWK7_9DELT|nr:response regulator transcription factor [Lujinxingia sediminis]RDV40007.1 DNA-binding response regulator [Bradymonadaceae bacterium TMQ3]RVU47946.1 response regulator transcription factor [Lujinxingia sediminis]TXC77247.1 response regulator transcription factor [Bradymonadales bacterium TMQ1]